ncbi:hypothetical protein L596_030608 [Steinernema carpocapsae]|nr:hypothetical protein L596_030608 [Steinernema carpocapsae]
MFAKRRRKQAKQYRAPVMPRLEEIVVASAALNASIGKVYGGDSNELQCIACHSKIDSNNNPGRVLTRAAYEMFGIDPKEQNAADLRICNKCQAGVAKQKTSGRCPTVGCTPRKKAKGLRTMPPKWRAITIEQREQIAISLKFPVETLRICQTCFKKLSKKLDQIASEILDEVPARKRLQSWTQEESALLKSVVDQVGMGKWEIVSEKLGIERFNAEKCQEQFEHLMLTNNRVGPPSVSATAANSTGSDDEEDGASAVGDEEAMEEPMPQVNEDGAGEPMAGVEEDSKNGVLNDLPKPIPQDTPNLAVSKPEIDDRASPKSAFGNFGKATNGSNTPKSEPSTSEASNARGSITQGTPLQRIPAFGAFGASPFGAVDASAMQSQNPSLNAMAAGMGALDVRNLLTGQGANSENPATRNMLLQLLMSSPSLAASLGQKDMDPALLQQLAAAAHLYGPDKSRPSPLHNPQFLDNLVMQRLSQQTPQVNQLLQQQQQQQQQQARIREQQARDLLARDQAAKQQRLLMEQKQKHQQQEQHQQAQQQRLRDQQQKLREEEAQKLRSQNVALQLQQQLTDRAPNLMQLGPLMNNYISGRIHNLNPPVVQQPVGRSEDTAKHASKSPAPTSLASGGSSAPTTSGGLQEMRQKYHTITLELQQLQKDLHNTPKAQDPERYERLVNALKKKENDRGVCEHVLRSLEKTEENQLQQQFNDSIVATVAQAAMGQHPQIVSKGAMKEFPANLMYRPGVIAGAPPSTQPQDPRLGGTSVIGINRAPVPSIASTSLTTSEHQKSTTKGVMDYFNAVTRDKIIADELSRPDTTSPKAQSPGASTATSSAHPNRQQMQRKSGLATVCLPSVPPTSQHRQSLQPHHHHHHIQQQRRPTSPNTAAKFSGGASSSGHSSQPSTSTAGSGGAEPTSGSCATPITNHRHAQATGDPLGPTVSSGSSTAAQYLHKTPLHESHFVVEAPTTAPSVVEPPESVASSSNVSADASAEPKEGEERAKSLSPPPPFPRVSSESSLAEPIAVDECHEPDSTSTEAHIENEAVEIQAESPLDAQDQDLPKTQDLKPQEAPEAVVASSVELSAHDLERPTSISSASESSFDSDPLDNSLSIPPPPPPPPPLLLKMNGSEDSPELLEPSQKENLETIPLISDEKPLPPLEDDEKENQMQLKDLKDAVKEATVDMLTLFDLMEIHPPNNKPSREPQDQEDEENEQNEENHSEDSKDASETSEKALKGIEPLQELQVPTTPVEPSYDYETLSDDENSNPD